MSNIALMNGLRMEVTTRTDADGIPLNIPHYRFVSAVTAADVLIAPLKLDGSGASSLAVDGSVTVQNFWHAAAASKVTIVRSLSLVLADGSLVAAGFGGLAALTNGLAVDLVATDGTTVLYDLTGGLSIKSHVDLGVLGAELAVHDFGSGDDFVIASWEFPAPIELTAAQRFRVRVRDDLTGLAAARAVISGHTRAA